MSEENPEGGDAPVIEKPPRRKDSKIPVVIAVENHKHAGQTVNKGDKITVTPSERDWLLKHNLIEV